LQQSSTADTSILRNLLDKIPDDLFGGQHQSSKVDELQQNATTAQMQNLQVSPKDPEEYTVYVQNIFRQIMPVIEWHDGLMKDISNATDKIPVLPKILEQLEEQLSMFIFSLIAPFIIPIIHQIGAELKTGSEEIIQSSVNEQHIVFDDSRSTDPTHSMLSKDHFSNVGLPLRLSLRTFPVRPSYRPNRLTPWYRFLMKLLAEPPPTLSAGLFPRSWRRSTMRALT